MLDHHPFYLIASPGGSRAIGIKRFKTVSEPSYSRSHVAVMAEVKNLASTLLAKALLQSVVDETLKDPSPDGDLARATRPEHRASCG